MNISILGTGNMATGLAVLFAKAGHTVTLGSRDAEKAKAAASKIGNGIAGVTDGKRVPRRVLRRIAAERPLLRIAHQPQPAHALDEHMRQHQRISSDRQQPRCRRDKQ